LIIEAVSGLTCLKLVVYTLLYFSIQAPNCFHYGAYSRDTHNVTTIADLLECAAMLCVPNDNSLLPFFFTYWMLSYDSRHDKYNTQYNKQRQQQLPPSPLLESLSHFVKPVHSNDDNDDYCGVAAQN